jgi:hypothetical protein
MTRLPLGQVTLCAVECKAPALAAQSLLQSMRHAAFGRVCLFTHDWLPAVVLPGIEIIDIEAIRTPAEQSQFVIRVLPHHVRTSHALLTRWDAFVVNPAAWTDEFLVHDFVGAPWPDQPDDQSVGQGAFSLRSRRFLRAGLDPRITDQHPEDVVMAQQRRVFLQDVHGVSFAPAALARRLVADDEAPESWQFGFLGAQHLPQVLDEDAMLEVVARVPHEFLLGDGSLRLAKALLMRGMPTATQALLARRQAVGAPEPDPMLLATAASVLGRLMPGS